MTNIKTVTNKKLVEYKQSRINEMDQLIKSWSGVKTSAVKTEVVKNYKALQKELKNYIKKLR